MNLSKENEGQKEEKQLLVIGEIQLKILKLHMFRKKNQCSQTHNHNKKATEPMFQFEPTQKMFAYIQLLSNFKDFTVWVRF